MSARKGTRSPLRRLSRDLRKAGYSVSPPTVRRLLKQRQYSLKGNRKHLEAGADHPDRDRLFEYLKTQKGAFQSKGGPILSVDTKKKELIGNFTNAGQTWNRKAPEVNVHDFPSQAEARAVP